MRQTYEGCIAGGAFGDGEAVVVGAWRSSPLGRFVDVFWVRPDGERILLAPTPEIRDTVAGLYIFDRAEAVTLRGGWDGSAIAVEAGPPGEGGTAGAAGGRGWLRLRLLAGPRDWRSWLFAVRPRRLRRSPAWIAFEDRVGRPLVGRLIGGADQVRTAGVAPGGQREWYGVDDWRPVIDGCLEIDGRDAGPLRRLPADLGVGLSAFPTTPAVVFVGTIVEGCRGRAGTM